MKFILAVQLFLKKQVDKIHNERIKLALMQTLPFWIASLLAGIVAVLYAELFAISEDLSLFLKKQYTWVIFVLAPVCFLVGAWLVNKFAKTARGSGIPQVMAAIELATPKDQKKIGKLLSIRIIIVKVLSSMVMVIGGAAIGREGPTIQIAGAIFQKVNEVIPSTWPKIAKRNMIMTGAAAGLAAAFNTPLGGIVFAVEELTKTHISYFRTALFSAVIIAGLTAQWLLGPYLFLGFPKVSDLSTYIFAGVILVAIISGLGGSIMGKLILKFLKWKANFKKPKHHWMLIISIGLIIASVTFFISPEISGSGKEVMNGLLFTADKKVEWYVPFLRIIGPILSFVVGGAGGIFAPSLSAGATLGAWISGWFSLTDSNANLLILAGMVGFLTGVTRTPFTSAILVLEMTDRHSIIFYLMMAAMIANLFSLLVDKHSFYDYLKKSYLNEVNYVEEIDPQPSSTEDRELAAEKS